MNTPPSPVHAEPWRVVLLEDDERLRGYFECSICDHPALALQASFSRLRDAQSWLETHPADILLTDLALPDGHGLELIYRLRRLQPACEVLVISVLGDEDTVLACVEAGAVGYIHKDAAPADMGRTIADVKGGASPISPMLARRLLERLRQVDLAPEGRPGPGTAPPPPVPLTPREHDVLRLIARGYTYAEIAEQEGITRHTVQMHIKNLYGKLSVHSRGQAVYEASRLGLVEPPRP